MIVHTYVNHLLPHLFMGQSDISPSQYRHICMKKFDANLLLLKWQFFKLGQGGFMIFVSDIIFCIDHYCAMVVSYKHCLLLFFI